MQRTAFTLVELSIVLVILGLLVGGVLAGQSLIHAAELRSLTTEFRAYQTALGAFREKYSALPGDMPNAVRFWGAAAGSNADGMDGTCSTLDTTTPNPTNLTCNGNGNGGIGPVSVDLTNHEYFRAWQHLALAGMIEGTYHGAWGPLGNAHSIARVNVPPTKYNGGGWFLQWVGNRVSPPSGMFTGDYKNVLQIGAFSEDDAPYLPLLKPEDAYTLDAKIDDGKAAFGIVRPNNGISACSTGNEYDVSNPDIVCTLLFMTGY